MRKPTSVENLATLFLYAHDTPIAELNHFLKIHFLCFLQHLNFEIVAFKPIELGSWDLSQKEDLNKSFKLG